MRFFLIYACLYSCLTYHWLYPGQPSLSTRTQLQQNKPLELKHRGFSSKDIISYCDSCLSNLNNLEEKGI